MSDSPKPAVRGALLGLHAQTATHPGSGTALGTVDLPVQRERHTHWPNVAGSALKGILRDACRERIAQRPGLDGLDRFDDERDKDTDEIIEEKRRPREGSKRQRADATLDLNAIFGPPAGSSSEFAGSLSVSDARIIAFPVRSLKGIYAWVTCPTALERLRRDAALAGIKADFSHPSPSSPDQAIVPAGSPCVVGTHVVLEEYEYQISEGDCGPLAKWLANTLLPDGEHYAATRERFSRHLIILHDDPFTHFARYATEIAARIGLNYDTKTVKTGALFYQEFLPAESLFYSVLLANPSRAKLGKSAKDAEAILTDVKGYLPDWLQVGGDETTGKGYCWVRFNGGNE